MKLLSLFETVKQETKIIAGFPGVGKSYLKKNSDNVSDSDSSKFPKEGFPANYIKHIKSLIGKKDMVLVSTHKAVLNALEDNDIEYTLVYPEEDLKSEYLNRYKERGSPEAFVNLLDSKWNDFMKDLKSAKPEKTIILKKGEYLKDRI